MKLCSCEHWYVVRIKPRGFVVGWGTQPFGRAVAGWACPVLGSLLFCSWIAAAAPVTAAADGGMRWLENYG